MRSRYLWFGLASIAFAGVASAGNSNGNGSGTVESAPVDAWGAFTCELLADGALPPQTVPEQIERDRQLMLGQPAADGFQHKVIPVSFSEDGVNLRTGGRYLFDTYAQARAYERFVKEDFVTEDGIQFLDRDLFLENDCYSHLVIGAQETAAVFNADGTTSRAAVRLERFSVDYPWLTWFYLYFAWPELRDEALSRDVNAIWLLFNPEAGLVTIVSFRDRVDPSWENPPVFDFDGADWATLGALAGMDPLGDVINPGSWAGWSSVLDRSDFALNVWPAFVPGDQGEPSQWPNSGPFLLPTCGDNVCAPSRGEDFDSCPADCTETCGDAVCDGDESETLCPGDCGL
ncbi:MAG: hypothetical protein AAFV53_40490 [Myxococcota bacterium]